MLDSGGTGRSRCAEQIANDVSAADVAVVVLLPVRFLLPMSCVLGWDGSMEIVWNIVWICDGKIRKDLMYCRLVSNPKIKRLFDDFLSFYTAY